MDEIDLHSHSTCFDGTRTPRQVVGLAKSIGLHPGALSDRDTVAGVGKPWRPSRPHPLSTAA
jgi:predicted metal-dependent phosphoesterase TrpH